MRRNLLPALLFLLAAGFIGTAAFQYFSPSSPGLTITWGTENSLDVLGFNLYRADAAEGDYVKVNESLIPTDPDPLVEREYEYTDNDVARRTDYFYQLELVYLDGRVERQDETIQLRAP